MDISANTVTIMGITADEVYTEDLPKNPDGSKQYQKLIANGTTYKVIKHTDESILSGFNALLLKDEKINKYVIAFRRTELSASDWITDLLAGSTNVNLQY